MPPIIGTAIRCMISEPVPVLHAMFHSFSFSQNCGQGKLAAAASNCVYCTSHSIRRP